MFEKISISEIPYTPEEIQVGTNEIIEQNGRIEESDELSNKRLKEVVQSSIAEEQIDSFQHLVEKSIKVPYAALAEQALSLYEAVTNAKNEEAELNEANALRLKELEDEVELALRLAPRKTTEIKQIEEVEQQRLKDKNRENLVAVLEEELSGVNGALESYGEAWPIPVAIPGEDRKILYELINETASENDAENAELFAEDIVPVTPEDRRHQVTIAEKAKHAIENSDASNYLTYYLAEQVGKVVTVEELIRFLYVVDAESNGHDSNYRTRVTTLLGPAIQGKRIRRYLSEQYGLSLQYGWRVLRQNDGSKWIEKRRTRIYRVVEDVPTADADRSFEQEINHGAKVIDELDQAVLFESNLSVSSDTAEIPVQEPATSLAEAAVDSEVEAEDWKEVLKLEVINAITRLKNDNLFISDENDGNSLAGSYIRALSSSTMIGTKTARARMGQANLMRPSEVKADSMTRRQLVISTVLNTNKNILGQRNKKQKEALALIDSIIEAELAKLES